MNHRTFELVSGVIFLLISIAHLVRVMLGTTVVAGGFNVPVWWSAVVVVGSSYLAWQALRLWRSTAVVRKY